jgi:hypothetical protein
MSQSPDSLLHLPVWKALPQVRRRHTAVLLQGERVPSPPAAEAAEFVRTLQTRFGDEVRPVAVRVRNDWSSRDLVVPILHDMDGEMHHAYDAEQASVYLVRPDGDRGSVRTGPTARP